MLFRCSLLPAVLLLATGCSGESPKDVPQVELIPLSGVVTVDGRPIPGAHVALHAQNDTSEFRLNPNGLTDAEGRFQLTTYSLNDGVPAGVWAVTVSWADVLNPGASEVEYGKEKLPRRYQMPASSGLTFVVAEDTSEPVVLSLSSR